MSVNVGLKAKDLGSWKERLGVGTCNALTKPLLPRVPLGQGQHVHQPRLIMVLRGGCVLWLPTFSIDWCRPQKPALFHSLRARSKGENVQVTAFQLD